MKTIWKYQVTIDDEIVVKMPSGAKILHVALQYGQPCIWALVDPDAPMADRKVIVRGTGHPITGEVDHLGTIHLMAADGELVFHFFEAAHV